MLEFLDLTFIVIAAITTFITAIILESLPEDMKLERNNKIIISIIIGLGVSGFIEYYSNQDVLLTSNYWD
jgi:hypothetical protein